jgi:hypothetical protein
MGSKQENPTNGGHYERHNQTERQGVDDVNHRGWFGELGDGVRATDAATQARTAQSLHPSAAQAVEDTGKSRTGATSGFWLDQHQS